MKLTPQIRKALASENGKLGQKKYRELLGEEEYKKVKSRARKGRKRPVDKSLDSHQTAC